MMQAQEMNYFPFSAIVGQDDFKLALLLNLVDPSLGGVLAIGDKGTGKTTLIRSLTSLMSQNEPFPFVNLPIGASEDRVLGNVSLEKLINDKKEEVQLGLLAKADQGFLYVDEINLLNDYLMDVLLDASSSGQYYLEREGVSRIFNSRFSLIGSMNPEEGNLRPQLKDRFGLSVNITTPQDIAMRTQIIQNRMLFDDDPKALTANFEEKEKELYQQIQDAKEALKNISMPADKIALCANIAKTHQVEGMRADILLIKTARAFTAFLGLDEITEENIRKIAPFVLNHRSNHQPPESPNEENDSDNYQNDQEQNNEEQGKDDQGGSNNTFQSILPHNSILNKEADTSSKKRGTINLAQRTNSSQEHQQGTKTVDNRKTVGQYLATNQFELKNKQQQAKTAKHIIFLLDSSGSMLKESVVAYAKGLIEKTIQENQAIKLAFSLISLYDGDAQLIAQSTQKIDELIQQLQEIPTGGKTNVVAAFRIIKTLINQQNGLNNDLVIVTDGRFDEAGINDFSDIITAYQTYCKGVNQLTIVDAEKGTVKLGLAKTFAEKTKGNYEQLIVG